MSIAGLRILVLEDEPIIALALEDLLIEGAAEPLFASTLAQGFAMLDSAAPDAAILDVNVHGERSYPLAARMRELGVPFVFATGYGSKGHTPEFEGTPTISKPYILPDLEAAIAQVRRR